MNYVRTNSRLILAALLCLIPSGALADIVCVPSPLVLNGSSPVGEVVITYTGGGSADVAGYSLDISWDADVAAATFTRPDAAPFATAATFFVVNLGAGHVRIDAAIGGAHPGIATGELCRMTLTAVASSASASTIALAIDDLRDSANQAITGVAAVNGLVEVDTGAPLVTDVLVTNQTLPHTDDFVKDTDALTVTANVSDDDPSFGAANISADLTALGGGAAVAPDTYVSPLATWSVGAATCTPADGTLTITVTAIDPGNNTTSNSDTITADNTPPSPLTGVGVLPGHEQLHLSWADFSGTDANPLGIVFRYAPWVGYPAYDGAAPAYPVDHTAGALALEVTAGTAVDWPIAPRDIYYVAGFVYDMVLQYGSAGAGNTGRATNYWLGDVGGTSGVDGVVDIVNDISQLGDTYGLLDTDPGFNPLCDVGPTDTGSPRGIPQPNDDHEIAFEDMMVFALNYSVVTPSTKSAADGGTPNLAWLPVAADTWALNLVSGGGDLQGLNLRAELPAGVSCSVAAGDLTASQSAPAFLRNNPRHGLDAGLALFGQGAGFVGNGELVRVTFSEPLSAIGVTVTARDANNEPLAVHLAGTRANALPVRLALTQNYPNPFNPHTKLTFAIPADQWVNLVIFDVGGARIRSLIDSAQVAGQHEVDWDGRDDAGRTVATGTYFARLRSGEDQEIRKMVLLK